METRKKCRITLQDALRGRFEKSGVDANGVHVELVSDLKALFDTLEGRELVDAFVRRIHREAAERLNLSIDADFQEITAGELDQVRAIVRNALQEFITLFILDEHREFMVRCHAQGISTAGAVTELMKEDEVMNRLAHDDALGLKLFREVLVHRMSYLKPGTARWPEQKYGAIWREARGTHKQMMHDMPLTSSAEQATLLVKHAERINYELESEKHTVKDLQILTNSLTKTIESLQKVSVVEGEPPVHLSEPQLVAVLERLTLALDTPEQLALTGNTGAVVSVLEQLTLALKAAGQNALGGGTEVSVEEAEVVSTESGGDSSESV